jgi:hypothetical protein
MHCVDGFIFIFVCSAGKGSVPDMKKAANATASKRPQRINTWMSQEAHALALNACDQYHETTGARANLGALISECVMKALSSLSGRPLVCRTFILETLSNITSCNGKPQKKPVKPATANKPPSRHTG